MVQPGMRSRRGLATMSALVISGAIVAGCSSGESSSDTTSSDATSAETTAVATTGPPPSSAAPTSTGSSAAGTAGTTAAPTSTSVGVNADSERFDAGAFDDNPAEGRNQWLPLTPGYQSVREGGVNKGSRRLPHRRVFTVTDVTKVIDGVRTVLVLDQDFDGGELAEQAIDYMAEDTEGNVWYLGSYTEAYEGGQFVNANDAWLAGVDGGEAGVVMMTDPTTDTPKYRQATVPGEGSAEAEVVATGESVCVPFNCYENVLVIEEDGSELTYFAPGVGGIKLEPESGDPQETDALINLTQLSAQGLAELSAEVMALDEHARSEASDVFGDSAPAERL